jgi:hypothetical protein
MRKRNLVGVERTGSELSLDADSPVLNRGSLSPGVGNSDERESEDEVEESEGEAEPVDLGGDEHKRGGELREKRAREREGGSTDGEETVALSACAVHLNPVPTELLDLLDGYVCPHQPGEHRVDAEEDLMKDAGWDRKQGQARPEWRSMLCVQATKGKTTYCESYSSGD